MTQYNSLNVMLSNSQHNKLKSAIKIETEITLRQSSSMISKSDDETNFPHKLLPTNRQVANLWRLLQIVYQLLSSYQKLSSPNNKIR